MSILARSKKFPIPFLVIAALTFTATRAGAQNVISANFEGNCTCEVLGLAGIVPVGNWNNLAGAASSSPQVLTDETGTPTGATISWVSTNTWSVPITADDQNSLMMKGYLDNDTFGTGITTVTVDNVPFAHYRVYIYFNDDNQGSGTIGAYSMGGVTIFGNEGGKLYDGVFKQAYGTSLTDTQVGNFLVFDGLSVPSFRLTAAPSVLRAPVNAIQIVAETTDELLRPNLTIQLASGQFSLRSLVKLNPNGNGIAPLTEPVVVQVGSSPISIPAGSFAENASGGFTFHGAIDGGAIDAQIAPTSDQKGFVFATYGFNPILKSATSNPLPVTITIGDDVATADVTPILQ